jgi:hypothetical protein
VLNADSVSVLLGNGDGTFQTHVDSAITYASVMAVGDFNRDGKADLAFATGGVSILLANGDGTFRKQVDYATGQDIVTGVAVGDFNGDGKPDVVATNYSLPNYFGIHMVDVLLGKSDGTFKQTVETPTTRYPLPVAVRHSRLRQRGRGRCGHQLSERNAGQRRRHIPDACGLLFGR